MRLRPADKTHQVARTIVAWGTGDVDGAQGVAAPHSTSCRQISEGETRQQKFDVSASIPGERFASKVVFSVLIVAPLQSASAQSETTPPEEAQGSRSESSYLQNTRAPHVNVSHDESGSSPVQLKVR
jgi:hypothetical protein